MSFDTPSVPEADTVEATLTYLLDEGIRPVSYAYPAPPGIPQQTGKPEPHRVRIANARALHAAPALDTHGFQRLEHTTSLHDFRDEALIRERYYPETDALLRRATGAEKVVIFDHTLRFDSEGHSEEGIREPVRRVHNDQTFISAPRRVRDHLPADEAEQRLQQRFAIINVWRPIGTPAVTAPLAMCDARSIAQSDLVPSDLVYRDKVGEIYSFKHNPQHRWFYFPELRPDEPLLLKIYDSRTDGIARLTAHTAFDHPATPISAPPRRSIELRCLVFWPAAPTTLH
ncbi:MAG: CmcJ/NvfI family oxidoreductase [Polyangiales bacterium]